MSWSRASLKNATSHKCAFCKHWYDVTNESIRPKMPTMGVWEYDTSAKKMCLKKNRDCPATFTCSKFEMKL